MFWRKWYGFKCLELDFFSFRCLVNHHRKYVSSIVAEAQTLLHHILHVFQTLLYHFFYITHAFYKPFPNKTIARCTNAHVFVLFHIFLLSSITIPIVAFGFSKSRKRKFFVKNADTFGNGLWSVFKSIRVRWFGGSTIDKIQVKCQSQIHNTFTLKRSKKHSANNLMIDVVDMQFRFFVDLTLFLTHLISMRMCDSLNSTHKKPTVKCAGLNTIFVFVSFWIFRWFLFFFFYFVMSDKWKSN